MADRSIAATFGDCLVHSATAAYDRVQLVVYEDGGIELHGVKVNGLSEPRIIKRAIPKPNEPRPWDAPEYRYDEYRFCSWFDEFKHAMPQASRLCPAHLPVFGVIEEPENG